jgi:MFS transporter, DHA2 family, multidrug resistance protein
MELKDLFYKWVPVWVKLPVLFLFFFVILTANGVYLGNSTDMYSGLGVYSEPFTAAYNAVYIGMALGLLIEVRLKMRFTSKQLLLWGFTVMALVNVINMYAENPAVFILSCLVLGFTKMSALMEIYIMWLVVWSKKLDTSRLYPFVYLTALGGIYFITWWTTQLAYTFNWRYAYIAIIMMVLVCLLLALIFVQHNKLRRPLPLYQMDIPGLLLLVVGLLLINYVVVYGKVENWWESETIQGATVLIPVALFAFLARELRVKRPLLPFTLFTHKNFQKGLLFFFLLGIFLPSSIQGVFTAGVLDFEEIRNAQLDLYLIPGVAAGAVLSFCWYYWKWNTELLLFIGFAAFVAYYILLYTKLATGLGMEDFWAMSLLKGFGTVVLYIVIGLYTTGGYPLTIIMHAGGMMILVRSFLGSGIISGIYAYLLYAGRVRHLDILAGNVAADVNNAPRGSWYYRDMQAQATMAASKEMCGFIIIIGLIILAAILFSHFYRLATHRHRILDYSSAAK